MVGLGVWAQPYKSVSGDIRWGGQERHCGSPGTSDGLASAKRSAFSRKAPCLYESSWESVMGYSV